MHTFRLLLIVGIFVFALSLARPVFASGNNIYAFYYLWWTDLHWHDKLGPNYPYAQLPLPATVDQYGCNSVSLYLNNQLSNVHDPLWNQDDPQVIEQDVRDAAAAGLTGFIVNWKGTGQANQTTTSYGFNRRLDSLVKAVNKINAEGTPFKLWISYEASAVLLSIDAIKNDMTYLQNTYSNVSAFDKTFSTRPLFIWQGSRKYPLATIQIISEQFRKSFFLIGDENWRTWQADTRYTLFDGDSYYWSSQDPYLNPNSFNQLKTLADQVRSTRNPDGSAKIWLAPFAPGYNAQLLGKGDNCVPRFGTDGSDTMTKLYQGNSATIPDGWTLISWNEIAEGTYVLPMKRWGRLFLDKLSQITKGKAPTVTVSPSIKPSATTTLPPTITISPTSQTNPASMVLKVLLHGIGTGGDNVNGTGVGNTNPLHPVRTITLSLSDSNNNEVFVKEQQVTFNKTTGIFEGEAIFNALPSGIYTAKISSPQYLQKNLPGIITLTQGQKTNPPAVALTTGDINADNRLSILDYNSILDCFSDLIPAKNCSDQTKKQLTDITDDGKVNQFDYNLFLRELSVQQGG